ncbi:hypothetical protein LSH36_1398g00015 [Paralvinella palmiformis]|uniref:Uncharacterized protein n=1 Tax=Paralvinella palmiformis TaxID=53620 RepID=A0AAD9MP49_9ANNE|nr:hypothetical protein LSH36_1398g00015 [Paralvinella palmiformis]
MSENAEEMAAVGALPPGYRYGLPPGPYSPYGDPGRPGSPGPVLMMAPRMPQYYQPPQVIQRPQYVQAVLPPQPRILMNPPQLAPQPAPQPLPQPIPYQVSQQQQQQHQPPAPQQAPQQRRKLCFYVDEGEKLPDGPFLVQISKEESYQKFGGQGALQPQGSSSLSVQALGGNFYSL